MADKYLCVGCERDGEIVNAESWCLDCDELVCQTCAKYHRRISPPHTIIHHKQDIDSLSSSIFSESKFCPVHSKNNLTYFCSKHDGLLCRICVSESHLGCEPLMLIEEAAVGVKNGSALSDLENRIDNLFNVLEKIEEKTNQSLENLEKKRNKIKREISDIKDELLGQISILEEKLIDDLDMKYNACREEIMSGAFSQIYIEEVKSMKNNLQLVKQYISDVHLFQAVKYIDVIVGKHEQEIRQTNENSKSELNFIRTADAENVCCMHFGKIEKVPVPESKPCAVSLDCNGQINYYKTKWNHIETFQTLAFGFDVSVHKGGFISDNDLLLTDNKKNYLHVCKLNGSDHNIITLDYNPSHVVIYNSNYAIVTGGSNGVFQLINLTTFQPEQKIQVGALCRGITSSNGRIWVDIGYRQLAEIDINGKILKKTKLSFIPWELACNKTCSLYSTVYCRNELYVITSDLDETEVSQHPDLTSPAGIVVDNDGDLYAAELKSNTIVRFSHDGKADGIVLSEGDGIRRPKGLSFNMTGTLLMIINNDGQSVSIFKKT